MAKENQILKADLKNTSEKIGQNINSVTGLPELRAVIEWFGKNTDSADFFSLVIYEITKYIHILEDYGINVIDKMILYVSQALREVYGENCYIGHVSDERFVIISGYDQVHDLALIHSVLETANKELMKIINKYNELSEECYCIELDYGFVSVEPGWNCRFEYFLKLANSEMLLNRLKKDLKLSNNTRTILWKHQEVFELLMEKNLFRYHFQPIVNAQDGNIFGYEALMRTEPVINMKPVEVIDMATNLGKLYDIEKSTMNNVMEYLLQNSAMFEEKKLFINSIPAHMLSSEDWEELVSKYGKLMHKMVVEMTEQTEMDDTQLSKFRDRLNKQHISLAIDDYGTGFSNLSNLIRYSPDYVKIDRALVQDIQDKPKVQKLVSGIIEFIHENGYSALAEGVETYDELKVMIGLGVDYIQGFYVAKPKDILINEIDKQFKDEIIKLNVMRSENVVKVYSPKENETVNLPQLATQHYNSILVDKENVIIEGVNETAVSCNIAIKDGIKSNITLRNISITTEKEGPLIDIGHGSDVTLNIEGANEIVNRGIRVPNGSSLYLTGKGALKIHSEMQNSYAIGGDNESSYGNITIEYLAQLILDITGENCVGIGGGKRASDSKISLMRTGINLVCAGGNSVGIGSFSGNSNIEMRNCDLEFKMDCANAVGIGALKGETRVLMENFSLNIRESGNNLCGVGVLNGGEGSILTSNGTIECDIRGKNIICVGTDYGILDCNVENSNTIFYCEGSSVVGIGDMNGRGNVCIHDANLSMTMLAKDILDIGSKNGRLEVVDSKRNIRLNE